MADVDLRRRLLGWHAREARPLAWRVTREAWPVLVSEIMLQQTQAARVEPRWSAFCARFPDPASCAAAPVAEVLSRWQGLGYNRRAVNLHRAAQAVVADHGGAVPDDLDALRALPGVGEYTARAVLAFAFGRDVAPVDTNIARVLSRAVLGRPAAPRDLQRCADELVPPGRAGPWAEALMDLGARVCTARVARCAGCPVARACAWGGDPAVPDPARSGAARARPQAAFAGSDRYHRGRLVDALRAGPVALDACAAAADLPDGSRVAAIVEGLVADGLAQRDGDRLRLPA